MISFMVILITLSLIFVIFHAAGYLIPHNSVAKFQTLVDDYNKSQQLILNDSVADSEEDFDFYKEVNEGLVHCYDFWSKVIDLLNVVVYF